MTGPEHYREAEKVLARTANAELGSQAEANLAAMALVHATLAQAAAFGMAIAVAADVGECDEGAAAREWLRAFGNQNEET